MALFDTLFRAFDILLGPFDELVGTFTDPDREEEELSGEVAGALAEATPADEVGAAVVDLVEEFILEDLQDAGEITPENVENVTDQTEGGAMSVLTGLGLAGSAVEGATLGQVDQQQEYITQAIAGLGVDDVTGLEMDARIQEGIMPAQQARVAKEHRAQFVSLPDAVETLLRAKTADEGWLRGDNVDPRWADVIGSTDPVNPNNLVEEWGIRDDNLEALERVSLEAVEIEELIESPVQFGIVPTAEEAEDVLQISGLPESTKDLFRRTIESAPRAADLWEQRTTTGDLVTELDSLVMDETLTPAQAIDVLPDEIDEARPALRERWGLLAGIPAGTPSQTEVEAAWAFGFRSIDEFLEQLDAAEFDVDEFGPEVDALLLEALEGDLRTARGLDLIDGQTYTDVADRVGLDDETVAQLLAGQDLDEIALRRLTAEDRDEGMTVGDILQIGPEREQALIQGGIETVDGLATADPEDVADLLAVDAEFAAQLIRQAQLRTS